MIRPIFFQVDTPETIAELAEGLDAFLRETDPLLSAGETPPPSKKKKRSSRSTDDTMDRVVAGNVDNVLLDCLEDELPSVTIDEEELTILSILNDYQSCDSLKLCNSRWMRPKKKAVPYSTPIVPKAQIQNGNGSESSEDLTEEEDVSSEVSSNGAGFRKRKRKLSASPKKDKSILSQLLQNKRGVITPAIAKTRCRSRDDDDEVPSPRRFRSGASKKSYREDSENDDEDDEFDIVQQQRRKPKKFMPKRSCSKGPKTKNQTF